MSTASARSSIGVDSAFMITTRAPADLAAGTAPAKGAVDSMLNLYGASPPGADYVATPWTCKAPERRTPAMPSIACSPPPRASSPTS